jgi:hypothetical protein
MSQYVRGGSESHHYVFLRGIFYTFPAMWGSRRMAGYNRQNQSMEVIDRLDCLLNNMFDEM